MNAQLALDHACLPSQEAALPAQSDEVSGALINLAGRRRLLSQRVVLYAVLASMGHDGAEATARSTLAQFSELHATLVEGRGKLPGVRGGALYDAYFGTLQGDKVIRAFIRLAAMALDAIGGDGVGAPVLLDQLIKTATPLLSVLNGLALVHEEQAHRHAQARRLQLQDMAAKLRTVSEQASSLALHAQVGAARAGAQAREDGAMVSGMAALAAELDALVGQVQAQSRAF
jgi:hypothetical protein